ncbi:MAG: hypothetical protein ACI9S6_001626 [Reinekea sp.]|jgi:hypothetical protein
MKLSQLIIMALIVFLATLASAEIHTPLILQCDQFLSKLYESVLYLSGAPN